MESFILKAKSRIGHAAVSLGLISSLTMLNICPGSDDHDLWQCSLSTAVDEGFKEGVASWAFIVFTCNNGIIFADSGVVPRVGDPEEAHAEVSLHLLKLMYFASD